MLAEGGREQARREGGDDGIEIGHARADGDQREHVEIARDQRLPAAHEEWPSGPQDHGRRQHELDEIRSVAWHKAMKPEDVASHLQCEYRKCDDEADPEPPGHVDQFVVRPHVGAGKFRFQRHAADRACAGPDLLDLGMHGAGEDRALGDCFKCRLRCFRVEITAGIACELRLATGGAEIIGLATMDMSPLGVMGVDRHAADGIDRHMRRVAMAVVVMGMNVGHPGSPRCARQVMADPINLPIMARSRAIS